MWALSQRKLVTNYSLFKKAKKEVINKKQKQKLFKEKFGCDFRFPRSTLVTH